MYNTAKILHTRAIVPARGIVSTVASTFPVTLKISSPSIVFILSPRRSSISITVVAPSVSGESFPVAAKTISSS